MPTSTTSSAPDAADAEDRARTAVADGVDALVALGGDGHGAHRDPGGRRHAALRWAIVGAGTGNDFARELRHPWTTRSRRPTSCVCDAHVVSTRCAVTAVGSAACSAPASTRWSTSGPTGCPGRKGRSRYNLAILAELRVFRPLPFELMLDGEVWETEAMLVAVGNGASYGGGMRVCPDAPLDDGLLDVTVLGPVSKPEFIRTSSRAVYKGTHVNHRAVTVRQAREVSLTRRVSSAYADGERFATAAGHLRGASPARCTCSRPERTLRSLGAFGT